MIADPGSSMAKPQRQVNTSLLEIPGDPPTFLETRDVPHGTIRAEVSPSALGVFSAGILGEPQPLTQALKAPEKINANVSYLYVTTGSKDPVTGPRTKEFIERLNQLKIPYTFEEYPDQIHSMEVWRPSLNKFIGELFK